MARVTAFFFNPKTENHWFKNFRNSSSMAKAVKGIEKKTRNKFRYSVKTKGSHLRTRLWGLDYHN